MITYFVHATSRDNLLGVRAGWNNPALSDVGVEQAKGLGESLSSESFDAIYTSDLERAIQTAKLALPNQTIIPEPKLREMNYGILNGQQDSDFPADEKWCIENRYEKGECCLDVENRMRRFLTEAYEPSKRIAVFSHRFPQLALEVILNKLTWQQAIDQDWRTKGGWQPGWRYV